MKTTYEGMHATWHRKWDGSTWGYRTIRGGTIRWSGHTYVLEPEPFDPPYTGQLDGLTALFYDYGNAAFPGRVWLHSFSQDLIEDEPNVIDGYICWTRWAVQP